MLNPRSIAVVGATPRLQYGGRMLAAALKAADRINVYPVNPRYDEVMGVQCYPSVSDLPEAPDVVGVVVSSGRSSLEPPLSKHAVVAMAKMARITIIFKLYRPIARLPLADSARSADSR